MKAISKSRKAVREALAQEGWRFSLASSVEEFKKHRDGCRTLTLPCGSESDNRVRTIREQVLRPIPWELRGEPCPRWLSHISKGARRNLQHHLPIAAEFCLAHGFIFLLGDLWAERNAGRWRVHRTDGPAVVLEDRELYFWRGWQVSKQTVMNKPTSERILSETITSDPGGNNGAENYTYDAVGNRQTLTSTIPSLPGSMSYSYDANDRLSTDTYDNDGNTISSGGTANTYDFENRMLTHGSVSLTYDGDGNRVSETVGSTTTKYLVDDHNPTGYSQVMDEIVNGSVNRTYAYGYQRNSENALVGNAWTPSFYGYDGHGNVRFLANTAASVTDSYDYDAFGMPIKTSGTTPNNYLYSGERYDSNVGLYDLRARYYNQATGRLWARDPYEGTSCSPLSYNSYIYTWDDPVDRIDPTGRLVAEDVEIRKLPFATIVGQTALTAAIICGLVKAGSGVIVAAANIGHPFTLENAGPCLFKASRILPSDCPPDQREPTPSNPGSTPFGPVRGSPCKINLDTGEIWCRDQLHKDHWEVYKNRRDWPDNRDRSVWDNGCLRQKF